MSNRIKELVEKARYYEKLKAENDALQNRCDFLEGKGL